MGGVGGKELTAVRLREGDDAVAVAVEERRVLVQRRRAGAGAGALQVAERRRPARFTEPGRNARIQQGESRSKADIWSDATEQSRCTAPGGGRATNRIERRTEAAKAQPRPPPPLGTPVVAEPCPPPFSGDSPALDCTLSRARKLNCFSPSLLPRRADYCADGCTPRPSAPPKK